MRRKLDDHKAKGKVIQIRSRIQHAQIQGYESGKRDCKETQKEFFFGKERTDNQEDLL